MTVKSPLRTALAAGTSIALGVVSSVAGTSAAFATSGPVGVPECDTLQDIVVDSNDINSSLDFSNDYVLSCVPQYGLGKVELTLNNDTDLPPGFNLADGLTTQSTDNFDVDEVRAYYGLDGLVGGELFPGAFQDIERVDDLSDPKSASFQAVVVLPLESVEVVPVDQLPVECTGTYTHAFRVTAEPRTTTLSAQTGSTIWTVPISISPIPIVWAVNIDVSDPLNHTTTGDGCIAVGDQAQAFNAEFDTDMVKLFTILFLGLGIFTADSLGGLAPGDVFTDIQPISTSISITEEPALPNTGLSTSRLWLGVWASVSLIGAGGVLLTLRRRRSSTRDA